MQGTEYAVRGVVMIIYGSVISESEVDLLRSNQMGIEITHYTNPDNLDNFDAFHPTVTQYIKGMRGISMHGSYYDMAYASGDPLIVEVTKKRFLQSIQAASFHGVNRLVFHSSYRTYYGAKPSWYIKTSIDFWKGFEHNIPDGMTVLLENVEDDNPEIFAEIVYGIDSPRICCCFDMAHAHAYSSVQLDKWIRVLGSKIEYVHMSDNDGKNDLHLPLGKGNLPLLNTINDVLKYAGDKVPFVMECDMSTSIGWIKSNKLI